MNQTTQELKEDKMKGLVPKRLRRLKDHEMVRRGDFVADEQRGFEPWDGPNGFMASAFVKPIYRRDGRRQPVTFDRT